MAFRLPPLNTLRLFEAAGRHLSFKLAAQELEVTPSGVSHGIQTLEEWLGTSLFARTSRGLTLTPSGQAYLPAVRSALTLLASASDRVPGRRPLNQILISAAPTFAARILLPRLGRYRALQPDVAVMIDTNHHMVEFPRDGVDLAVRIGRGRWPDLQAVELLKEELVPVCSPELKRSLREPLNPCDAPLIHVTTATQDWNAWAEAAGIGDISCERALRVDTIQMAFDAAVRGLGIAIGRRPLVDSELRDGRLVVCGAPTIVSSTSYWLVGTEDTMNRPEIVNFVSWLRGEMEELSSTGEDASRKLPAA